MATFFLTAFWTPTFHDFFEIVLDFGPTRVSKSNPILRENGPHFRQIPPKWQKWAPRGPKASQKTPKWSPRVPKWSPKASQIEVLGLKTVVKKGREFRPFRRSTTHTTQHNTTEHNTTQNHTTPHHTTQHNTTQHNESVNPGIPASMHPRIKEKARWRGCP